MSDLFDLPFEDDEPAAADATTPVAARRVLTVTELTARIRDLLEAEFGEVWVEGELSNCRVWNTGHLYFTLKDASAQIRGVMFRSALRYLKFKPEDGLRVVARGRVSVYEPKGEYQLVCEHLEPHGLGALQLAFEQLKKRLQAEGLFDAARKRPLPALPRKIGIVTSLDGAAHPRHHQGAAAPLRRTRTSSSARRACRAKARPPRSRAALQAIARVPGVDVVIVGRGGGSIEDLWAFNEEVVARAIARVAGAGHLGGRPRDRRHDRGLRRRPARADAVGGGRARRRAQGRVLRRGSIGSSERLAARRARAHAAAAAAASTCSTAGRRSPASRRGSRCAAATPPS